MQGISIPAGARLVAGGEQCSALCHGLPGMPAGPTWCAGAARFEAAAVLILVPQIKHSGCLCKQGDRSRGQVCPTERGSRAELPCSSHPRGRGGSQSRATQLAVTALCVELGSCPVASLASRPSVPRRARCRALVALGPRWLTVMAQPSQLSSPPPPASSLQPLQPRLGSSWPRHLFTRRNCSTQAPHSSQIASSSFSGGKVISGRRKA